MLNVSRGRRVQIQERVQDCQSDEESTWTLSPSSDQPRCQIEQMLSGYILSNSVEKIISPSVSDVSDLVSVKNRCVVIVVNKSSSRTRSSGPKVVRPQLPLLDWRLAWPIPGEKAAFRCAVNKSDDHIRQYLLLRSSEPKSLIQTVGIFIYKDNIIRISMRCESIQEEAFKAYASLLGFKSKISRGIFWATSDHELEWASLCLQKYTTLPSHIYKLLGRVVALSSPSPSPSPSPSNTRAGLKYAQCPEFSLPGEIVRFLRISQMMQ